MRRAKIVGTLGPSSDSIEKIKELIESGLNVARINMSHGTHEGHAQVISNVREASKQTGYEVAVLLDLQGPKIRVDKLSEALELKKGEVWGICPSSCKEKYKDYKNLIPTIYEDLVKDANVGCSILFDDGLIQSKAIKKEGQLLEIEILEGGTLKSNKGINLPDVNVSAPSFTEKDRKDLIFGLRQGVDYVAMSFVRKPEDIKEVKYLLHSLKMNIPIVAKIEKPEAILNIEKIIDFTDVIMIARGDMGVELGNHLVPSIQKKIIKRCNAKGVPVITATQMLESMVEHSTPTRAEASDVANAIWDGTDAVMLSGETAAGKYPVHAVKMMNKIIEESEKTPRERPLLRKIDLKSVSAANMVAASLVAEKIDAKWIVAVTQSGNSCLKLTRFRPKTRVLGVANSIQTVRRMCLLWGISPYLLQHDNDNLSDLAQHMINQIKERGLVKNRDHVVVTHGDGKFFQAGTSNTVRVETINEITTLEGGGDFLEKVQFEKGEIRLDTNICASCQNCISVCPHDIWMRSERDNHRTQIDKTKAKNCSLDLECVDSCPTGAIEIFAKT